MSQPPLVSLSTVVTAIVAMKVLLFHCYFSTDFEVHRNWMAVTFHLPLRQWYTDTTSKWTLDYPPLFAYFEFLLSTLAYRIDPNIVTLQSEPYLSDTVLLFQRSSVLLADFFYHFSVWRLMLAFDECSTLGTAMKARRKYVLGALLFASPHLILLDSVHFQYNSFLTGFFLLSIANIMRKRYLFGAFWYCVLVNFKHIYLYFAPAYVAVYLRCFLFADFSPIKFVGRSLRLGVVMLIPFFISFGPFFYFEQIPAVFARLFPVHRGLTHAYWAPNFWALYNAADLCLYHLLKVLKLVHMANIVPPTYTSGLVQEYSHSVLPNVSASFSALLTILSLLPFLYLTIHGKLDSLPMVILTSFNCFMFGYHVHEKAVILFLLPFTILALQQAKYAKNLFLLSTVSLFSLFPLFFTQFEIFLCILFSILFCGCLVVSLPYAFNFHSFFPSPLLKAYLFVLFLLQVYRSVVHVLLFGDKLPFLPLMATSVLCALGLAYVWVDTIWTSCGKSACLPMYRWMWTKKQNRLKISLIEADTEEWQSEINSPAGSPDGLNFVGGVDISTSLHDDSLACAAFVILSYPQLEVVYSDCVEVLIDAPYIAGLLAFREVDVLCEMLRYLKGSRPDIYPQVVFVDGNGILHPNGFGLACHLGVLTGTPTIGVAKNLHHLEQLELTKDDVKNVKKPSGIAYLKSKTGAVLGASLAVAQGAKNSVYVSVGHRVSLQTALTLTRNCSVVRVPEPTRQADIASRAYVREHWDS